jgi:hypothetical protein
LSVELGDVESIERNPMRSDSEPQHVFQIIRRNRFEVKRTVVGASSRCSTPDPFGKPIMRAIRSVSPHR